MTETEKLITDLKKAVKFARSADGSLDYYKVNDELAKLFERSSDSSKSLANAIFDYWEKEHVTSSKSFVEGNEPTEDNIRLLGAFNAFLNKSDELEELVSNEDWREIGVLVNYEAEDMEIGELTELMSILVDHGAI